MPNVRGQLSKLWSPSCLKLLIKPLLEIVSQLPEAPPPPPSLQEQPPEVETNNVAKQFFKKASEKMKATAAGVSGPPAPRGGYTKLGSPECMKVALVCAMYQNALKTLGQLRIEILAGKQCMLLLTFMKEMYVLASLRKL